RDADVQKLHDAEKTVNGYTICSVPALSPDESVDEYHDALRDNHTISLPCEISKTKILRYFKNAQLRFELVMFDAQYIADHCAVSGRVNGALNQFTCDRTLDKHDARFANATQDFGRFTASYQSAVAEGRREISLREIDPNADLP